MKQSSQKVLLSELLKPWYSCDFTTTYISGMTLDSREINGGDLFVALKGALLDGRHFIDKAVQLGASAVLSETKDINEHGKTYLNGNTPIIEFYQLSSILSALSYRFNFPEQDLHKVIAVTGTNGKTTIASLLANCFTLLGNKSAQMGTIGNGVFGSLKSSLNTTLDALSVFSELNKYQQKHVDYTVMEVSSHGLCQGRVSALPFHSAIFSNLSRDHLDYHETMASYAAAKKSLFSEFPLHQRIINADDDIGKQWLKDFPDAIAYGFNAGMFAQQHQYVEIVEVEYLAQGIQFTFNSSWGNGKINAPFYGDFNVANLSAVLAQLLAEKFSVKSLQTIFTQLSPVPGRMEQYNFPLQKVTFIVDYAHTPDALEKALIALQNHKSSGRIVCVFGCGGDRDKGKRAEMAKVAEAFAEKVVLVDDNPRTEPAIEIIEDILTGFKCPDAIQVSHDREQAMRFLIKESQENDIILLAGKGHEDYQIIGDKRIDYSDREVLSLLQKEYGKVDL